MSMVEGLDRPAPARAGRRGVDREHGGRFPANRFTATDLLAKVVLNVAALAGLLVLALRENGHELAAKRP
ncbi:hypothetical protein GCM10009765_35460 [Fodinicola feengrottensis]|uniref:Uncharacterized protein n=1 Tax=Fodinicola feengrottensis TaxID=435914 RepID=A0ABN2H780_9ACTN